MGLISTLSNRHPQARRIVWDRAKGAGLGVQIVCLFAREACVCTGDGMSRRFGIHVLARTAHAFLWTTGGKGGGGGRGVAPTLGSCPYV